MFAPSAGGESWKVKRECWAWPALMILWVRRTWPGWEWAAFSLQSTETWGRASPVFIRTTSGCLSAMMLASCPWKKIWPSGSTLLWVRSLLCITNYYSLQGEKNKYIHFFPPQVVQTQVFFNLGSWIGGCTCEKHHHGTLFTSAYFKFLLVEDEKDPKMFSLIKAFRTIYAVRFL